MAAENRFRWFREDLCDAVVIVSGNVLCSIFPSRRRKGKYRP
jgi:hypothetical protein